MERCVIKRDGSIVKIDITKIQKQTSAAVVGLKNVSQEELERDANIRFNNKIKTSEIQEILITTAVSKIDIDRPDWTYVAARLTLYDLYHNVKHRSLKDYFNSDHHRNIPNIEKYNLDELDNYIDENRDLQFNYLGVKTLIDRYILKDSGGNPKEKPQHMFMAIAMYLAQNEEDVMLWSKKFYDLISKFEVMLATPTLSNAGVEHGQLSSCFVTAIHNSLEGIEDDNKDFALMSKFGGGVGTYYGNITSIGGSVRGIKGAAGGKIPFLKIRDSMSVAYDQLGVRKASNTVYCEDYDIDIEDFIELKKNSGEERRRTHDLFPAVNIHNLFLERVKRDEDWTLFDAKDAQELNKLSGDEFEKMYRAMESNESLRKKKVNAKKLWKEILRNYFETGNPFLHFKDEANRRHMLKEISPILSSNLCMELAQYTKPYEYEAEVLMNDGSVRRYKANENIMNDKRVVKKAERLNQLDWIGGVKVEQVSLKPINGESAVCNLASINLSKINSKEDIQRVVPIAIRMLDNVIDLNYYPTMAAYRHNRKTRGIGLGVMGEMQMLAEKGIYFGSKEHYKLIDELMEAISFNTYNASCDLAIEKGKFELFDKSEYAKGLTIKDTQNKEILKISNVSNFDWKWLSKKIVANGLRNGYLMAIAPTSSISILVGTSQAIEPIYKRKWYEVNMIGEIPVTAPNLNPDTWSFYESAYDIDMRKIVIAGAIRQKWIDQGQSLNIFIRLDKASGKYLNEIYTLGAKVGIKSFYYLRSQSPEVNEEIIDRSMECVGCQ